MKKKIIATVVIAMIGVGTLAPAFATNKEDKLAQVLALLKNKLDNRGGSSTPAAINGQCGTTDDMCATGFQGAGYGHIPDSGTHFRWKCHGQNGGATDVCNVPKNISKNQQIKVMGDVVNIRKIPRGTKVGQAKSGEIYEKIGQKTDSQGNLRYKIVFQGQHAYIYTSLTKVIGEENQPAAINGQCGTTDDMCATGFQGAGYGHIPDSGTHFRWKCHGQNGGATDVCNVPKNKPAAINGQCGTTDDMCATGFQGAGYGHIPDSGTHFRWKCHGQNGGATDVCNVPKNVSKNQQITIKVKALYLRKKPMQAGLVLVKRGETYNIIESTTDSDGDPWHKISAKGYVGWVTGMSQYTTVQ